MEAEQDEDGRDSWVKENGLVRLINPAGLQTSLVYRQKKPWLQRKEALFVVQTRLLWKWIRKVLDSAL